VNRTAASEAVVAILLAVVLIGLGSQYTENGDGSPDMRASTFVNDESGLRALYLLLDEVGIATERVEDPITPDFAPDRTVVLASPSEPLTENEVLDLLEWTRSGGRLVVVGSLLAAPSTSRLFTAAGFTAGGLPSRAETITTTEHWPAWKGLDLIAWPAPARLDELETATADPWLGESKTLIEGNSGALVIQRSMGEGEIVLVAEVRALSNQVLRRGDNALAAVGLLLGDPSENRTVAFDEFHHGFRRGGPRASLGAALLARLTSTWSGRALLVLVVAGFVYLAGAAVRFGAAAPGDPPRRRALSEHADALGRLLEASRSTRESLSLLTAGVRRTVGPRVGMPPTLLPRTFRERLGARDTPGAAELAQALERAERLPAGRPREFARIARSLARARRRFIHGRS